MWYVYELSDPRNDEIRYVGATNNPTGRLKKHERSRVKTTGAWCARLRLESTVPKMTIIQTGEKLEMLRYEAAHRRKLKDERNTILECGYPEQSKDKHFCDVSPAEPLEKRLIDAAIYLGCNPKNLSEWGVRFGGCYACEKAVAHLLVEVARHHAE
ncbi:hypothetical protein LCGC14_0552350 [marine sediment metagenome]|uniref:GIY-YIG domain-containing protein n=1 Tax=marine sediment metagenome TaxID=412755 RepID=A0A0F9S852_9ZZZZ